MLPAFPSHFAYQALPDLCFNPLRSFDALRSCENFYAGLGRDTAGQPRGSLVRVARDFAGGPLRLSPPERITTFVPTRAGGFSPPVRDFRLRWNLPQRHA